MSDNINQLGPTVDLTVEHCPKMKRVTDVMTRTQQATNSSNARTPMNSELQLSKGGNSRIVRSQISSPIDKENVINKAQSSVTKVQSPPDYVVTLHSEMLVSQKEITTEIKSLNDSVSNLHKDVVDSATVKIELLQGMINKESKVIEDSTKVINLLTDIKNNQTTAINKQIVIIQLLEDMKRSQDVFNSKLQGCNALLVSERD